MLKYRKETVKSPVGGEGVRYYLEQGHTANLREIAQRIESKQGISSVDTLRIMWSFFDEIIPMLTDGNKIEITDYCSLVASITKDKDGKPKAGIQFNTLGALKKAMTNAKYKQCLNTDKTAE